MAAGHCGGWSCWWLFVVLVGRGGDCRLVITVMVDVFVAIMLFWEVLDI